MAEQPVIGIDLGSTYTRVAVCDGSKFRMIPDDQGNDAMPSYVAFTDSAVLVGEAARDQAEHNPANTIYDVTHLIGRRYSDPSVQSDICLLPFKVIASPDDNLLVEVLWKMKLWHFTLVQICSMILMQVKKNAETTLGATITEAVISVPVDYTQEQQEAMKQAGIIAGFNLRKITSSPVLACIFYESIINDYHDVLVFNLGCRTFNVSVLQIRHGVFRVKATAADSHLGGEHFDNRLLNHFLQVIKRKHKKDISDNPRVLKRLQSACEQAKIALSYTASTELEVSCLYEGVDFVSYISQAQFEKLNMDLFKKCMEIVMKCMKDAGIRETYIHKVVLVGGSTRIPMVQQLLQELFHGKNLCKNSVPGEVVAYGAAVQANAIKQGNFKFLNNVCSYVKPVSLDIETQAAKLGRQKKMGQFSRRYVHPEKDAIGIDFGASKSSVAVWQGNGVKIIENEHGSHLTGSDVTFTEIGKLIGASADEHVLKNPANVISNIKCLIGRCSDHLVHQGNKNILPFSVVRGDNNRAMISVHYKGKDKNFAPEEIASMVLAKMKEMAEVHFNSKITNAVISVPACFSDSQRKAIQDAAVIAGLNVIQLLNEPTAVAIAYFWQNCGKHSDDKTLLIFDLGACHLDVAILTINAGIIKVQAVTGDTNLGGDDFHNNMVSHFVETFLKEKRSNICNRSRSLKRLRAACEKAKIILSQYTHTTIEIISLDGGIDFCTTISRAFFEELNKSLFTKCIEHVEKCLEDAKLEKSSIDEVVLLGGSSKIPKMKQILQEFFSGKELCKCMDLDTTVAYGAAVRAAMLCGNIDIKKFCGFEVQDVTSSSLALEGKGGLMNLLISKNTPIPTKKEHLFSTCSSNLTSVTLEVHECELASRIIYTLSGIIPKRRGNSEINACFSIDHNGVLNVTAKDISTIYKNEIVIHKENGGLTKKEIQKMVEAAAHYKAEDEKDKMRAEALNFLESFAYKMKAIARDPAVSSSSKNSVAKAADDVLNWLETNYHATVDEISARTKLLASIKSQIVYLGTTAGV